MSPYKVENAPDAMRNLAHLLSVMGDLRFNMSLGETDDRLDSLLWIARDLAEGIVDCNETKSAARYGGQPE